MKKVNNNNNNNINNNNITESFISLPLERQCLSLLLKFPSLLPEIDEYINTECFQDSDGVHAILYTKIRDLLLKNGLKKIDIVLLSESIKELGITTKADFTILDYLKTLELNTITQESGVSSFKQLKKYHILRQLALSAREEYEFLKKNVEQDISSIIHGVDLIHNETVRKVDIQSEVINIFENVESVVEQIGNDPPDDSKFIMGPFPTINRILGSLHRPGNISLLAARSGFGKTNLALFWNVYVAEKYNLPILHCDNGEMSIQELQFRSICMLSQGKVPYWAIETGKWRKNPQWLQIVRNIWPRVKKIKFYYEDVSSLDGLGIIALIRRYSFGVFGRQNQFVVNFDYLKPFDELNVNHPDWKVLGTFMKNVKSFINGEINIPFFCSIQLNRYGITTNKMSKDVDDSENSISLSDRVMHATSHTLIGRHKTQDEILEEHNAFGNMKLLWVKHRHLGVDFEDATRWVKMGQNKFRKNYANLNYQTFHFEDLGDLNQMAEDLREKYNTGENHDDDSHL